MVEDCSNSVKIINQILSEKHNLTLVSTFADAKKYLNVRQFDLLLLDVTLPDGNGFDLYEWIKTGLNQKTPTIFLTGQNELASRLKGFELGAQDYITKPFYPEELAARIESRLKMSESELLSSRTHLCGDLKFEWNQQRVFLLQNNQEISLNLTPNEYKILSFLCENVEKIITRQEIINYVWGTSFSMSNKVINTHVSNLRKKMKTTQCEISAIEGKGYCLKINKILQLGETQMMHSIPDKSIKTDSDVA